MKKAKLTIEDLAKMMQGGFKSADKKMEVGFRDVYKTIEDLAIMVQNGFDEAKIEVNQRFDLVDKRFNKIEDWQRFADGKFDVIEHELISIKHDSENFVRRNEFENVRERVDRMEAISGSKKK